MGKKLFILLILAYVHPTQAMDHPSQEQLNADLFMAMRDGNLEKARSLVANGADVNATNENGFPALWAALYPKENMTPLSELLLDHGADIRNQYPSSIHMLGIIALRDPRLLTRIVLAPNAHALEHSYKMVKTILLCLKRVCPNLPRDLRFMILAAISHPEETRWGEEDIVGNVMIARKLRGLPIPIFFKETAINTLYECTMSGLIREFEQLMKQPESTSIDEAYTSRIQPLWLRLTYIIDLDTFERQYQEAISKTVIARLEQDTLVCNNPSQAFGTLSEPISVKTKKCAIQ